MKYLEEKAEEIDWKAIALVWVVFESKNVILLSDFYFLYFIYGRRTYPYGRTY